MSEREVMASDAYKHKNIRLEVTKNIDLANQRRCLADDAKYPLMECLILHPRQTSMTIRRIIPSEKWTDMKKSATFLNFSFLVLHNLLFCKIQTFLQQTDKCMHASLQISHCRGLSFSCSHTSAVTLGLLRKNPRKE